MSHNRKNRSTFSGSLGFVLAAAGSAVGLGNIWRFPFLAARDGGGLFVCLYVILALTFGFTLLITEIAIGRRSAQGPLTAYGYFNRKWKYVGWLSFIVPYFIYPYYCVIGGWVLKYLVTYLCFQGEAAAEDGFFSTFITSQWSPLFYMTLFALMSTYIVYCGVNKGIERYSRIIMPALVVIVIFICGYGLTLSHTDPATGIQRTGLEGAAKYLIPDFSIVTKADGTFDIKHFLMIMLDAMGQLFYSLSIAMGIMIAYGSYMRKDVNLGKAVDNIEIFDTAIALLAGLMIIPAVYIFSGTEGMSAGPGLMFIALPKVFASLGFMGEIVGLLFFVMVLFAAATSCVSILEATTVSGIDKMKWSRTKSVSIMSSTGFILSIIVCLGYNVFYFKYELPNGAIGQILDIFDYCTNNVLMPICAFCTCILIGWVCKPRLLIGEMRLNGYKFRRKHLYIVMLRYIAPILLFILLLGAFGIY